MKALILVGGLGSRLRPLTTKVPKPLIEFVNKPMMLHQVEALRTAGVTEIVLAINYCSDVLQSFFLERQLGVKITFSHESEPLGTAGPLALARDLLLDGSGQPFFVLNADVICDYPLAEFIKFHSGHKGEASIMVTKVQNPSSYGVVLYNEETGLVDKFVEKPKDFVGDKINAGIYLLNPSVVDKIELKPTSMEREVFPVLARNKQLFAMVIGGFWMDIGQPRDFISAQLLYLEHQMPGTQVVIHPTADVSHRAIISSNVCIGPLCKIEDEACLSNCVILNNAHIKKDARVSGSIVGWDTVVEEHASLENAIKLGEQVHLI